MNGKIFLLIGCILLLQAPLNAQTSCCCGVPRQLDFPGFDFELDPFPLPNTYFNFLAPSTFGPWIITQGSIDFAGPEYCGGLGLGNPNGQSHYIDLYGSPSNGSGQAGTIQFPLFGLTPGYEYTLEFWYATYTANGNFSATVKVANGAWLNANWTANNPGSVVWLKKSYKFIAQANNTFLSFTDTGSSSPTVQIGMLIDDIKLIECPKDLEEPQVLNPPEDYEVECENEIPPVPVLQITDNCDAAPKINFIEKVQTMDHCTKKITRIWEIKDSCGNLHIEDQIIDLSNKLPPTFTKLPIDTTIYCQQDVSKIFAEWYQNHAYAQVTNTCDSIQWQSKFNHLPGI